MPEGFGAVLTAIGGRAQINAATHRAMAPDVKFDDLSPHNIHGRWAALLAKEMGSTIEISVEKLNIINLAVVF